MIATAALLFAVNDGQIAAMAERIRAIEAEVGQDQTGVWRCSLSASSGNAAVDDALCQTNIECAQAHGNDREALGWCVERGRSEILAGLQAGRT